MYSITIRVSPGSLLQSKIHRGVVTDININYEGSITISTDSMSLIGLREYQKILVVDINNGQRFETYVIESAERNVICLNGAATRLVMVGDRVIIMTFSLIDKVPENYKPKIIVLDEKMR